MFKNSFAGQSIALWLRLLVPSSLFITGASLTLLARSPYDQHTTSPSVSTKPHLLGSLLSAPNCTIIAGVNDRCPEWIATYDNPNGNTTSNNGTFVGTEESYAVLLSLDGRRIYMTGFGWDNTTQSLDIATVTFGTTTGAQIWVARYNGPQSIQCGAGGCHAGIAM